MATDRFKELILYISQESEFDPNFGATKLNKILFFCDFLSYRAYGQSISGKRYFKLPHGPAPRALKSAVAELIAEGACIEVERSHFGLPQKRIIVKREADVEVFSATEVALIGRVIRALWDNSVQEVSHLSHRFVGWQLAALHEDIPYEAVFLNSPSELILSDEEIAYGQRLALEPVEEVA